MARSQPEAALAADLVKFMRKMGWRVFRHHVGFIPGGGSFGEKGMPDYLFVRYTYPGRIGGRGKCLLMWIETKPPGHKDRCQCSPAVTGPGKRPGTTKIVRRAVECRACGQASWQRRETDLGALVLVVDDMDRFEAEYNRAFGWLHKEAE